MNYSGTRPKYPVINVRGLILIYVLLCALTVLFSRTFFSEALRDGSIPGRLNQIIFFTIPAVLLVFFAYSLWGIFRDLASRRTGSKFKARLLAYFIITVVFAAVPVTIVTALAMNELLDFWRAIETGRAAQAAQNFALEAYSLHTEKLENLAHDVDFDPWLEEAAAEPALTLPAESAPAAGQPTPVLPAPVLPAGILAVQDFVPQADRSWQSRGFAGDSLYRLIVPPVSQEGFAGREMPRDTDVIRYALYTSQAAGSPLRVLTYHLGPGFDDAVGVIENQVQQFEIIDSLRANLRSFLVFYYVVLFFPTLLMTAIITISFTRRVTQPLVDLTEATRRVAEGDFSVQILARQGDELGLLINSFNAMVRDLEKTREALIRSEKISIWQNMAQQLAHEIKNPLTPIKLSAERVLRRWQNNPERIGEIVESTMLAIVQEVEGLSTLLTEFRTLSRPMEPSQSTTELREAIEESIVPYRSSHPNVRFATNHVAEKITVKIDKHRMNQILTNLFINAIDAMNDRGLIEIRTDLVKKRESRYCRLSIRDTGKGISKKEGSLIFTPYFTTKETGTGLGLPIVERIVNDHGGSIWFNSAEEMGTTFFIDLPVITGRQSEAGQPAEPISSEGEDGRNPYH
ncbi:MAG: HAMP domain-containing protein [Treponema sp.]|nr:HAMP domain-containing protein [Treponema sp.]